MTVTPDLLANGDMEIEGRMPYSSNATFLVTMRDGLYSTQGIYKPTRGERPLWDFPSGLHRREVCAHRLSHWLGWDVVPRTVLRDGPLGEGSVQQFIEADFAQHYFTIFEEHHDLHPTLRRIAALDIVANNTDRKSGHCLLGLDGRVHAIDNGLCFGVESKLRTVIWEFATEPIDGEIADGLSRVVAGVPEEISELLADEEVECLVARARRLVDQGCFPVDRSGRGYPWPLV
jgi:uncharacterized repeat protein (TIGR03843 family)